MMADIPDHPEIACALATGYPHPVKEYFVNCEDCGNELTGIVVSLVLTLVAFFAYVGYTGMTFAWFHVVAAVIVAFMVAYAAMFGFDKLKEALSKIKDLET